MKKLRLVIKLDPQLYLHYYCLWSHQGKVTPKERERKGVTEWEPKAEIERKKKGGREGEKEKRKRQTGKKALVFFASDIKWASHLQTPDVWMSKICRKLSWHTISSHRLDHCVQPYVKLSGAFWWIGYHWSQRNASSLVLNLRIGHPRVKHSHSYATSGKR